MSQFIIRNLGGDTRVPCIEDINPNGQQYGGIMVLTLQIGEIFALLILVLI